MHSAGSCASGASAGQGSGASVGPGGGAAPGLGGAAPGPGGAELAAVLERLGAEEPPLLWVGPLAADSPRIRDAVRYAALEINEHLETYFDRREHALEVNVADEHTLRNKLTSQVSNGSCEYSARQ